MTLNKWKTLQELTRVLRVPYEGTIALQNQCITLSDVFGIWKKMEIRLKAYASAPAFKTQLSQELVKALHARKQPIFNTPEMQSCILLDPRFRSVVLRDTNAFECAKEYLINIWTRIQATKVNKDGSSNASSEFHVSIDEQFELNKMMQGDAMRSQNLSIEQAIDDFQPDLLPSEKNVLEFWQTQKDSFLYDVAMAVLSIPPTQVNIEQHFSSVGHIFTERRFQLAPERLRDILMIHLNKDVFNSVKQEQLQNIII